MAIKPIELIIKARDEASGVLGTLQGKLTAVGAAVAAYFGINAFIGAVKGAADLETGMSRVQAATGASTEEMKLLRQAAEDAGANTKYTSTEAAGALETLAKAGLSATDAIAALPAVLNLAQAGDIELGQASEFLTKAVMGMGLAFSDAGRVADVLARGANATNTSVTGLAEALSYAAPVANSLGLSLETTVAIIGKFADAGIDASRAGTALNSILSQFGDPASKFRQELGAAGITTNNFEEALHQLAKAGPSGSKAINAVGQEAGPALRALLGQGMGALDDLTAKLKAAEGSAAATAKVMQDNLNGSLGGLSSAWDTLKTALATPVLPVLKDGVDQLAGAFKSAVSDGTIGRFGEAIATSFQAGIKWAREFAAQVDFRQLTTDLRAFADRSGEVFTQIGEYATNAGNIVKTVYGVMSAGTNVVLGAVYGIGEAFAGVASNIQSGLALLMDGFAKVTFGKLSASFKAAAAEVRLSAEATWAASEALGAKSSAAFLSVANGAQLARDGFTGLSASMTAGKPAADASAQAIAGVAQQLQAVAEKNATARKATEDKKAADEGATVVMAQLRGEYAALIAGGNLQAAAEKLQEINKALQATPPAAGNATKAAQDAAQAIADAFQRMGVTSSAELKLQANNALRDYNIIKGAGTSTAEDIAAAFKVYAEKAIAANNGMATSWVTANAAAHGYELQVDKAGKATLQAASSGVKGVDELAESYKKVGAAAESAGEKAVSALERQNAAIERANAATEKAIELENKRRGVDSSGFSTNKDGSRLVMGTDVGTLTGVAAFLKAAGVSDDAAARKLALEFSDGRGNIPFLSNPGQIKYGGKSSTMSMALLKAAETYTFGTGSGSSSAKTPSTIPTPTTTVNINLNGTTRSVNTDAAGALVLQDVLNQLATARSTAAR